jgi:hypothetical protein
VGRFRTPERCAGSRKFLGDSLLELIGVESHGPFEAVVGDAPVATDEIETIGMSGIVGPHPIVDSVDERRYGLQ